MVSEMKLKRDYLERGHLQLGTVSRANDQRSGFSRLGLVGNGR